MTDESPSPALFDALGHDLFPGHLGIEVTSIEDGVLRAQLELRPEHFAPNGFVHAGVLVTLADTAAGYGCLAHLPPGASGFTTLELNGLRDPLTFFIVTAVIVLLTFTALILFTESPMGRVLQAIRESEERARGCGYNTRLVQLVTFVIAGAVAGLAGGLFAMLNNFVGLQPYWLLSGVVLIMVILGGRSSLFGPFLGAVLYLLLESTLSRYTDSWQFFVGAIFVVCVLLFPQGLWGLLTTTLPRALRRMRRAR